MKKSLALVVLLLCCGAIALAESSDSVTIGFEVQEINAVSLHLSSIRLAIGDADPGQPPKYKFAGVSHAVTTNGTNKKLTGVLDANVEEGLTITAAFDSDEDNNGLSTGETELSDAPVDLVTGISKRASSAASTFFLYADVDAGVVAPSTRTFTLTLVDGAN